LGIGKELFTLCDIIGYSFNDISNLEKALTHSSYSNELKNRGFRIESNETLEFLGDAVLQIVISEELFDRFKGKSEDVLTEVRKTLVCESTLARIAESISLGDYLNVGTGEETSGVRQRPRILGDALEALVAAIYIDDRGFGGENYKRVVLSLFKDEIELAIKQGHVDYKTMLQQFVEKNGDSVLKYEYGESGPEHNKVFYVTAFINNNKVGEGRGTTKRSAEMQAAMEALKLFGII